MKIKCKCGRLVGTTKKNGQMELLLNIVQAKVEKIRSQRVDILYAQKQKPKLILNSS